MLHALVAAQLGIERGRTLIDGLVLDRRLVDSDEPSPEVIAHALGIVLLHDLLERVPDATAYVEDRWAAGGRLHLDHLTVHTVAGVGCGELDEGKGSVARVLGPLGRVAPFVVEELRAERFSPAFNEAAARVVGSSRDPLTGLAQVNLARLAAEGHLPRNAADSLLGELAACFARHHATPSLADYETVLAESAEMAWIATDGTSVAGATVRAETSAAPAPARFTSTAERKFRVGERATETRTVPGPYFVVIR